MTTRADIAAALARRLRGLAADAGLSAVASDTQTEGDYSDPIDSALRALGLVDASQITDATRDALLDAATRELLISLQLHYATLVDLKVGEREEKLSQIRGALAAFQASGAGGRRIVVRALRRVADDYELGSRPNEQL